MNNPSDSTVCNNVYFILQWKVQSLEEVELSKNYDLIKDVYYIRYPYFSVTQQAGSVLTEEQTLVLW